MNKLELNKNMEKIIPVNIGQSLSGKYKVVIVNKNDEVVWEQKNWEKNLILNQGMEYVYSTTYTNLMGYAANGTGQRVNSIISGESSASVSSTTLTLIPVGSGLLSLTSSVGGYSSAVAVGDMIKFEDASEVRILEMTNQSASITPTSTITGQPFTIYKTSQIGLQNEIHRSATYFPGDDFCGNTITGNQVKNRRTWDFQYETSSVNYTEIGVGWGNSGNSTIFSRVLLPVSVSIDNGQKMRLMYEMSISAYPSASSPGVPFTASISGWPVSPATDTGGYYNISYFGVSKIGTSGYSYSGELDPYYPNILFISNCSASNSNFSNSFDRTGTSYTWVRSTKSPYVPLSFTLYKTGTFTTSQFNRNDARTIGIGLLDYYGDYYAGDVFCCVFNQNQTKSNIQTLTLSFVWTWGRTLA